MCNVGIQTTELISTREATERMVNIIENNYTIADLEEVVSNITHMNAEEITQILGRLKYFGSLFGSNIRDWDTEPVNIDLNTYYKQFNCKYYPVPRINKETIGKELQQLVEI